VRAIKVYGAFILKCAMETLRLKCIEPLDSLPSAAAATIIMVRTATASTL
jgi:hypothetical protein